MIKAPDIKLKTPWAMPDPTNSVDPLNGLSAKYDLEKELKEMRIDEQNRNGKKGYCAECGIPLSHGKYCGDCIH